MPSTATSMLDGLSTSVAIKAPCVTVATSNITLSGLQTINGVAVAEGDRVLVTAQTSAVNNGIYTASTGSWTRALDADGNRDLVQGTRVMVRSDSIDGIEYELTTENPITIGTSSLTFELRYGANATYDQTALEAAAGVVPVNESYRPGYLLRYGNNSIPGTTNMTTAFANALLANPGLTIYLPGETILVGNVGGLASAGTRIVGDSKYTTIVRAASGTTGAIFSNPSAASGSSAFCVIEKMRIDLNGENCTAVDFSSVNNSTLRDFFIDCGPNLAGAIGTGVKFGAPLSSGAYNNVVSHGRIDYAATGVLWGEGANFNRVEHVDFIGNALGANLNPGGVGVENPVIRSCRFEGGTKGILEGAQRGHYYDLWMENNATSDVEFVAASVESHWFGGLTAATATPIVNLSLASSIYAISPDLIGVLMRSSSASRAHILAGPNVVMPQGNTDVVAIPAGVGTTALYVHEGRLIMTNAEWIGSRNAAGTGVVLMWQVNANDQMYSNVPVGLPSYTVATLPAANVGASRMIYVSDESGGAVLAFSDNVNWRRVTDRAIVS